jgi:hypothetical protein
MKLTVLFFLLLFVFSVSAFAQNSYSVKGVIADSVERVKLGTASVAVLQAKDSVLVNFAYAGRDGSFSVTGLTAGKFILLVTYPDYADYTEEFSLDPAKPVHDFGMISMSLKTRLLKEVLIKGTASQMKIKGDTTEFNARAFVIQPNAKVEDLLKQLPGITVDKDGKITAQGQTISKVLVDGEEFFGDDPTLVTRNIRADMVDKIQLYDKKSDQAAFTGVDDGKTQKTINVKLREDKKQGIFGKVQGGESLDNIYQGQLLFNAFKNKEKFSVYGTAGNNGKVGLSWEDNQKYGTGDQVDINDNGISVNTQSPDDLDVFSGLYFGQGFPLSRMAGIHYDSKWNNDKESANINYKIESLRLTGTTNVLTQNNYPGNILNSGSDQTYNNYMFRQKLGLIYQAKLDTSSNLKISVDGTSKNSNTHNIYTSADTLNGALVNNQNRRLDNTVDQRAFNGSAFYTRKFKKPGRTFSVLVSEAYSQSTANGFLVSHINYYNTQQQVDSTKDINENKTNNLQSSIFNTNLTYSEPFTKTLTLVLNYGIGMNHASADRNTFSPSSAGVYSVRVDSLSSNYVFNQFLDHAGAILNYKKGKLVVNFGTHITDDHFNQVDELTGKVSNREFVDWAPQAHFEYRFSQMKSIQLDYKGTTTQPTLEQLQPVASNVNPLNIIIGNANLTPSFANAFNFNYRSYKVTSDQFFGVYGNYTFITNPIINHIKYTPAGQSVSQYFNLSDKQSANFFGGFNFGRKIPALGGLNAGIGFNMNGSNGYNYSNDSLNMSKNYVFNPLLILQMFKQKKIEFGFQGGPTYTTSETSLQPKVNNNGWGARGGLNGTIYLPGKFQIGTYSDFQYSAATASFHQSYSRVNLSAFIIKNFLKNDNLMVELWGNDLLNQNSGFSRVAQANVITQTVSNTLKRYFMLTINYDFTKMGAGVKQ